MYNLLLRNKVKLVLCIIFIVFILISYAKANNEIDSTNNQMFKYKSTSVNFSIQKKTNKTIYVTKIVLESIAKELYKEFNSYADMLEEENRKSPMENRIRGTDNPALYYAIMACDRATGILGVYKTYFSNDEIDRLTRKYKKIQSQVGNGLPIYYGYSKTGLHFMAISPNFVTGQFAYRSAINRLMNYKKEMEFLNDIYDLSFDIQFKVLDVFVEDLTKQRVDVTYDISLSCGDSSNVFELKRIEKPENTALNQIFTKYEREYSDNPKIKNKEWKLFFFDKLVGWPDITIKSEGDDIVLVDE